MGDSLDAIKSWQKDELVLLRWRDEVTASAQL